MKKYFHKLVFLNLFFATAALVAQPYPIVFVTQVPIPSDFTTIGATFGNHKASMKRVGRGGDLWVKYPDSTLKNLTAAAGYGAAGLQGANAIAVRDPSVHWDGNKIVFSMIVGAPTEQYQVNTFYWQLYEMTGIAKGQTPVITKVSNQPANYNNISPIYGTDDRIIYTSDRPRNGQRHLYPQLDEYEMTAVNTGLWSLDQSTGDLILLNHAPSGDFTPIIDSFGRVIFTQWDHLQQDQMADSDRKKVAANQPLSHGTFNFSSEASNASANFNDRSEVFPEPRDSSIQLDANSNLEGHRFNHFFPWMINEDGTELETLNHIGRHELHDYLPRTFNDDSNVKEYYGQYPRINPNPIDDMFQVKEHPTIPGRYFGVDAPTFRSHASGQIIAMDAPPALNADQVVALYITHRETADISNSPSANHSGLYRDPLPLSDNTLISAHTSETREDKNEGSRSNPQSRYAYKLKEIVPAANGNYAAGTSLIPSGISKTISYWDPDVLVSYSGPLWEWQPVEVRSRARPTRLTSTLPAIEQQVFDQENVNVTEFKNFLKQKNLSLIINRDVTSRDDQDKQQPSNLRVTGTNKQNLGASGKVYDISHLQIFQADQVRAMRQSDGDIDEGRRVIGQVMHTEEALTMNPNLTNSPPGSVAIADDGSIAAFVPTRRALAWQTTDPQHTPVVRERNWLNFQPGEIRTCPACHGVNDKSQSGQGSPVNPPLALAKLLQYWKTSLSLPHDHNDDNKADIFWRNETTGENYLYFMDSNNISSHGEINTVSDQNWKVAGLGDFNGDGKSDILWRNANTGINYIYLLDGKSIISHGAINTVPDSNWKVAGLGDFNGDGKSDILWRNANTGINYIYFLNGISIASHGLINSLPDQNWQVAGVGDLNSDRKSDIIWRNTATGLNFVYLMNNTNISSAAVINAIPDQSWKIAGMADFNADGNSDILWRNDSSGINYIYFLNGSSIITHGYVNSVSDLNWEVAQLGDFNGNGKADILWRNKNTGSNLIYFMDNSTITSNGFVNVVSDSTWKIIKN